MKRKILAALLLATGSFYCFQKPILLWIEALIERRCAIQTLASWNLPPTEENLALYRSMNSETTTLAEVPPPPDVNRQAGSTENTNDLFTDRWRFADLWADKPLRIGVYSQDNYDTERFSKAVVVPPALAPKIHLHYLKTERDFLDALATDDIVLFFGHANLGRGLYFAPARGGHGLLPLGNEILSMPARYRKDSDVVIGATSNGLLLVGRSASALAQLTVNCKVFWCLACRSDAYYRDMWTNRYPRCHLVTVNYLWNSISNTRVLAELMEGLQNRHPLQTIIARINAASAADILFGRVAEITDYGNATNLSPRLLNLY